jgi:hypothetical protein
MANVSSEDLAKAQSPKTPPDELRQLATSKAIAIRRAVAQNPSTPTEILLVLAAELPVEFCENPIFSLLLFESPSFIDKIPPRTLSKLFRFEALPSIFLEKANEEVRIYAARLKDTSVHILRQLAVDPSKGVRAQVARNEKLPSDLVEKLSQDSEVTVRQAVSLRQTLTAEIAERLSIDKEAEVRSSVARHPNIPINLLEKLSMDVGLEVRRSVAAHPRCTPEILLSLALDEDETLLLSLLKHPKLSKEAIELLSGAEYPLVRGRSLDDPRRDPELARFMKGLPKELWQFDLAPKPRGLTREQRLRLARGGFGARRLIASDTEAEADILEELLDGAIEEPRFFSVLLLIMRNPSTPDSFLERPPQGRQIDEALLSRPSLPPHIFARICMSQDLYVRILVSRDARCPEHILEKLSNEPEVGVRAAVADNKKAPGFLLERLAMDRSFIVRSCAARNLNTPPALLLKLSRDEIVEVRYSAKHNPNTPKG